MQANDQWKKKYRQHLKDAKRRGIPSLLSLEDYMKKVEAVGMTSPDQIGKHKGQFVLGRYTDEGPYTRESCRFIPCEDNLTEAFDNGRHDNWIALRQGKTKENSEHMRKISETLTGRTKETHAGPAKVSAALSGRTKETHDYLARQAERQTGQTKETSELYRKMSKTKTGRTKENHAGVAAQAEAMRGRTKETHAGVAKVAEALSGRTKESHAYIAETADKLRGRSAATHDYIARTAKAVGDAHRGTTKETHEYVARRTDKLSGCFLVRSPDGVFCTGKNMNEFASSKGLDPSSMAKVLTGKLIHFHGWHGRKLDNFQEIDYSRPRYTISILEAVKALAKGSTNKDALFPFYLGLAWDSARNWQSYGVVLEQYIFDYPEAATTLEILTLSLMTTLKALKLYQADGSVGDLQFFCLRDRFSIEVGYFK
jgi:phage tail tube protein FII